MTWSNQNRTCWYPETVNSWSGFDAVSLPQEIYNATYTSIPLKRRTVIKPYDGGTDSSEASLLKEFYESNNPDGSMIIPIIGEAGVGKSHLIAFLHQNAPRNSNTHVVYIPKSGTDLRASIGLIVANLDSRYDGIRTDLAFAQSNYMSTEEASARLLTAIFHQVKSRSLNKSSSDDAPTLSLLKQAAELLDDAHFRLKILELGGPQRLVAGPMGEDLDIPDYKRAVFVQEDLPFGAINRDHLADTARQAFSNFSTTKTTQKKFIEFINKAVTGAMQEVFWSNGPSLITLMREVRRLLLEENKELFILIEDLAVLSGVQLDLLQAFISPTIEVLGGSAEIAPLRVAFAITTEPFRGMLNTLSSRIPSIYAIDLPSNSEDDSQVVFGSVEQISFISKYLNASRYTPDELKKLETNKLTQSLKSRCDTCEVSNDCLNDFGHHDGVGLYPFTQSALVNLLSLSSKGSFNPRLALRGVLAPLLREGLTEIPENKFPSDEIMNSFLNRENVLDSSLAKEMKDRFGNDLPRRLNLQRFWTTDPSVRDPWTEWIRHCFGLGPDNNRTTVIPPVVILPTATQPEKRQFTFFDAWAMGKETIPDSHARDLRSVIYGLVTTQLEDRYGIPICAPLFDDGKGTFIRRDSFEIAESEGGKGTAGAWKTIVKRDIENAVILKYILTSITTGSTKSAEYVHKIKDFVEPMVQEARSEYSKNIHLYWKEESDKSSLVEKVTELNYIAKIFGDEGENFNETLNKNFSLTLRSQSRSDQWIDYITKLQNKRLIHIDEVLAVVGTSKEGGATLSSRIAAVTPSSSMIAGTTINNLRKIAAEEFKSDQKKIGEILGILGGQNINDLIVNLRTIITKIERNLTGRICSDQKLMAFSRQVDYLEKTWDGNLISESKILDPDEIVKSVTYTDTSELNRIFSELSEIVAFVSECATRATDIGNEGLGSPNVVQGIQSALNDLHTIMGGFQ